MLAPPDTRNTRRGRSRDPRGYKGNSDGGQRVPGGRYSEGRRGSPAEGTHLLNGGGYSEGTHSGRNYWDTASTPPRTPPPNAPDTRAYRPNVAVLLTRNTRKAVACKSSTRTVGKVRLFGSSSTSSPLAGGRRQAVHAGGGVERMPIRHRV